MAGRHLRLGAGRDSVTQSEITRVLAASGVPAPEVDAELLLRHAPGGRLADAVARRCKREPLQLIVGTVGFRYLEVAARPGVFIPRPETEVLAGAAVERTPPGGLVLEPCTGSGVVAISVATETDRARVYAADISSDAVDLARANATANGADVSLSEGDLLEAFPPKFRGGVDVLVANPPYVAAGEVAGFEPEVADWDPRMALVSGPTGHEFSDRLFTAACEWLTEGGWVLVEVAEHRAAAAAERARAGGLTDVAIIDDLTGRPRVVAGRRPC